MLYESEKKNCCGCTACESICPRGAIRMTEDEEGFRYPQVDKARCVSCGLCDGVCPVKHPPKAEEGQRRTYVLRTKVMDTLMQSTSGGFVTPLAQWVLEQDGTVCAAAYDGEFRVVHSFFTAQEGDLNRVRGSKYVQSDLGDCFRRIRELLKQGKLLCFVGTTCQVNGLKAYLGKDYDNLITVDLVCHGVPSPKLFRKYVDYQKEKSGSGIREMAFRNKTYGYHSGTMKVAFDNGRVYYGSGRVDYMLKSFFSEISSRPSCYACAFKTLERCSDFTIYDCWHAEALVKGLKDDDRGYTNVIIQSRKGAELFEKIRSRYEAWETDTEQAVKLDGKMVRRSAVPHPKRNEFYRDLDAHSLSRHIQQFLPVSRKDYVVESSKKFLYRSGIYGRLQAVVKKRRKKKA